LKTTPFEADVSSSNFPPPLVWTCQKKKKNIFFTTFAMDC